MPEREVGKIKKKRRARDLVMIAMLCALVVVISLVLRMTIPISAGSALVIISGISFGPGAGFIVGALSRLVLNFYEGQGPWTLWQMVSWGMLGALGGICFNRLNIEKLHERNFKIIAGPLVMIVMAIILAYISYLILPGEDTSIFGWRLYAFGGAGLIAGVIIQRKRLPIDDLTLCLFTFFSIFILYGGIMNICAMIISDQGMSVSILRALYITGVPYDAMHAGTAALFMFIFGPKLITMLERIKIKYGFYRN